MFACESVIQTSPPNLSDISLLKHYPTSIIARVFLSLWVFFYRAKNLSKYLLGLYIFQKLEDLALDA